MAEAVSNQDTTERAAPAKQRLVNPGMGLLFASLIGCFTAWGIAADLTTPMVAGFKHIFEMSTFQASLVQLAYFGAYFLLALPAAMINERFGYKAGLLSGLGLAAAGAFLFYPASKILTYEAFLVALFALAAGCSILETSANPYVISLGPEATATRRLNFAQAFNPLGTNIGVMIAATPSGWRMDIAHLSGSSDGTVSPNIRRPSPAMRNAMSMPSWTSPRASASTLPISRVIARASRSLWSAINCPNR